MSSSVSSQPTSSSICMNEMGLPPLSLWLAAIAFVGFGCAMWPRREPRAGLPPMARESALAHLMKLEGDAVVRTRTGWSIIR